MATQVRVQPAIVGSILNQNQHRFAGGAEEPEFVEAASQTFDAGDLIYLVSGKATICGVDGGSLLNTAIAGLAKSKATGTTDAAIHFEVIRPDTILEMNLTHTTAASAASARSQLGTVYAIKKVSGIWCVDLENTAEDATTKLGKARVIGFKDPLADVYGRVYVQIVPITLETDGGTWLRNLQLG